MRRFHLLYLLAIQCHSHHEFLHEDNNPLGQLNEVFLHMLLQERDTWHTGATPYDLLLSSLGACKAMTMRMYAERKGYKLEHAEVRLSHDKIHAADCENCETKSGKIDQIKTEITLTGDLSDEERQKIFEIAERCPVHRTITSEIIIEATLKT